MHKKENLNIARISTVPFFVYSQLSNQLRDIHSSGANVTIITSPAEPYEKEIIFEPIHSLIELRIPRDIEFLNDIRALISMYSTFKTEKFDIIHSTTPKAGLLSSIAGYFARTPLRIHTFTGQTWAESKGLKRLFFKMLDSLIISLNHHCYADSESQMMFLISEGVCQKNDISVLGSGSLSGVNLERFNAKNFSDTDNAALRDALNISHDSMVIIFVGRITKDKGILELLKAFEQLLLNQFDVSLLLVGPVDEELLVDGLEFHSYISKNNKIVATGFTDSPEKYLSIADIFCLPSYREGFGTVIIESAAMGLPSVASKIYGLSDAVKDGETGILVDVKCVPSLVSALGKLLDNNMLRAEMGLKACYRAKSEFDSFELSKLVFDEYNTLLGNISNR